MKMPASVSFDFAPPSPYQSPHAPPFPRPLHPPRLSPHSHLHGRHCLVWSRRVSCRQRVVFFSGGISGRVLRDAHGRGDPGVAQKQVCPGQGGAEDHCAHRGKACPGLPWRPFFRAELAAHWGHDRIRANLGSAASQRGREDRAVRDGRLRTGLLQSLALGCLEKITCPDAVEPDRP